MKNSYKCGKWNYLKINLILDSIKPDTIEQILQ